jgi:hypothetical protein
MKYISIANTFKTLKCVLHINRRGVPIQFYFDNS